MSISEQKVKELVNKFKQLVDSEKSIIDHRTYQEVITDNAKQCAVICIENEYNSLREQLFNLRACRVIESERTYLFRIQELIEQEKEAKQEIEKL